MRIKRIDLCGFKSFCDKASLDLQQPVTGIVGPNGCGKSNVVDALRWAMGEQSARHLRGKSMEDVIFNGSETRGPSGMAEISITFENDRRAALPYLDYAEITVTRRLHRDGTSEYLINKVPVRLRDITNLFLGTGVGTKAYSIIEQGRVGLIVSSKPEERRHFIEEAAGITKYRRRKQLAERKIDATRQNLLRVSDVIDEIGRRLGSLRRQAQKAERYKRYREEMRDIELWSASHRLLEQIAWQKLTEGELNSTERARSEAASSLEQRETQIAGARHEAMEHEREITRLQEELYRHDNQIKLHESRIEYQGRESGELRRRAEQSRGEIEQLRRQLGEEQARASEVKQAVTELRAQRDAQRDEMREREQVARDLRAELGALESAIERERELLRAAERAATRAEGDLQGAGQRQQDLEEQLQRRREEARRTLEKQAGLGLEAEKLDGELERLGSGRSELASRREEAAARLGELTSLAERGEAELEVLRTELHRRRSRLTSLEEIHARYEGFGHGTRAVMQRHNGHAKERGVLGLVADVIDAPADYETALEAVLGHRLGTVIVEDTSVGIDAIHYLKQGSLGRGSFIARSNPRHGVLREAPVGFVWDAAGEGEPPPRSSSVGPTSKGQRSSSMGAGGLATIADGSGATVELSAGVRGPLLGLVACEAEYRSVAEVLLSDVVVVDDLDRAMQLWDRADRNTLVTLEGEILQPDGTVTGGSKDAEISGFLQQKREIKELSEIIADLQGRYDDAHERHVSVKAEITTLRQTLDQLKRAEHEGEKEILALEKDLGRISSEAETLGTRHRDLNEELERLELSLTDLERLRERAAAELDRSAETRGLSQDTLFLLERERKRLVALVNDAGSAATDVKVALAQSEASCAAMERSLQQVEQMSREHAARVERLERESCSDVGRAGELEESVKSLSAELGQLSDGRAAVQEALSAARGAHDERLEALGELEGEVKEARSRQDELNARLGELQLRCSELKMARRHLEEQIWERYREELPRVAGDYHLKPPVTTQQEDRIKQLRQIIERMGEINLTAIDEYNELSGRFEFLSAQKEDLESALNQLQRAIQKINRTCRERFVQTFEAVNAKFQEVFPRLFRGGRARLQLTAADDVLQGGVEIVAQPPGKKLVSIDMMSGGEKALTATSLIFAMFLVKPTPFCLLDEVDAPLDDANVIRLRDLVREMSETSQFIVITHNHTTMEAADKLYGVTMEEPGISRLVSVNLTEAQRVAA